MSNLAKMISFIQDRKLVGQDYLAQLAHTRDFVVQSPFIESIHVVIKLREIKA